MVATHEVVNDNSNPYRNIVMDAIRMNQGNVSQCSIVEEEPCLTSKNPRGIRLAIFRLLFALITSLGVAT